MPWAYTRGNHGYEVSISMVVLDPPEKMELVINTNRWRASRTDVQAFTSVGVELLLKPVAVELVDRVVGVVEQLLEGCEGSGHRPVSGRPVVHGRDDPVDLLDLVPQPLHLAGGPCLANPPVQLAEARKDGLKQPLNRRLHRTGVVYRLHSVGRSRWQRTAREEDEGERGEH